MPRRLPFLLLASLFASSALSASEVRVWIDAAEVNLFDTSHAILTVPADLAGKDVVDLRATDGDLIALTADKRVYVWGALGSDNIQVVPPAIQGHAIAIGTTETAAFAVLDSGVVISWGDDTGQLRNSTPSAANFAAVGSGSLWSGGVAWTNDGVPTTWGGNMPIVPSGTLVAQAIGVRAGVIYRRLSDNQVVYFGSMGYLPLLTPPTPAITATSLSLAIDGRAMYAITPSKTVVGWGNSTTGNLAVPADLKNVTQVAAGRTQALARLGTGEVAIWGTGVSGSWSIPSNISHVRLVAAGYGFSAVVISSAPKSLAWKSGGTVVDNATVGSVIGSLVATDPDSLDRTFTYALVSGSGDEGNSSVLIDGGDVKVAVSLPAGAAEMTIRVRVTDSSGASFETPLVIQRTKAPDQGGDSKNGILGCGVGGGLGLIFLAGWAFLARMKWRL